MINYIRKIHCFRKQDKRYESDLQMLTRVGSKFVVLFFIILMFDTMLDWFLQLVDIVIELFHLGIDFIEYSLELLLEHFLHTDHYHSEIIIVNAAIIGFIFIIYLAYKNAPRLYVRMKNNFSTAYVTRKDYELSCWHVLTLVRKIKVVVMYCFCITCFLFLVTL